MLLLPNPTTPRVTNHPKAKISKISKTRVVPSLKGNSYRKEQVTIQVGYKYNTSTIQVGYKYNTSWGTGRVQVGNKVESKKD